MTSIEVSKSRPVYSRLDDGQVYKVSMATKVLHRCHGQRSLGSKARVLCGNLFNRSMKAHSYLDDGICPVCGYKRSVPVQGYVDGSQDLLVADGSHPVLLINTNGNLKRSKSGKVQIGTRWLEYQEMDRSDVFNLHLNMKKIGDVIEVRDMG